MRTVRNSSRLLGGGCTWSGGWPGPGGCTWSWGVYLVPGGVPTWGMYLVPGMYLPRGCTWSGGVCTWSWGYLPRYSPLWTEWLTDRCKKITFVTSLRTVKIKNNQHHACIPEVVHYLTVYNVPFKLIMVEVSIQINTNTRSMICFRICFCRFASVEILILSSNQ